jgi:MFS family permease
MAVYFLAMYALGAAFGPVATGWLSDHFAATAAWNTGIHQPVHGSMIEPFRALGLLRAMYVIPVLSAILAGVLFAGSKTVALDVGRLNAWLRNGRAE